MEKKTIAAIRNEWNEKIMDYIPNVDTDMKEQNN